MIFRKLAAWLMLASLAAPAFADPVKPLVIKSGQTQQIKSTDTLTPPNNVQYWGVAGDGTTDDGAKIASAISAAQNTSDPVVFPHTTNGYLLNSGGFPLGTYPSQTWSWPGNTSVYPSIGWFSMGSNRFQGTAIGNPEACTGFLFSPYTQTCLAITDYKIIMDPASVWSGPNTTNVGLSIGCLPNHRSPNASNVTGAGLRRNWIACVYTEVDTGQDGQPNAGGMGFGSSISTEFVNEALNIGSNHGINREINVNVYGSPTDGGISRAEFILASCGPFNTGTYSGTTSCQASVKSGKSPWGVTSEIGNGIEMGATPFTSTTAPSAQTNGFGEIVYSGSPGNYLVYPRWTNGLDIGGSVYNVTARGAVTGESGQYFRAINAAGGTDFYIDKLNGNVNTVGSVTASAYGSFGGSVAISGTAGTFRFTHYDTAGVTRWETGVDAGSESGSNAGSNFYISRKSDVGGALDAPLTINRATGLVTLADGLTVSSGTTTTQALNGTNIAASGTVTANGGVTIANGAAGTFRFLRIDSSGSERWEIGSDAAAESGSNAGSDLYISRRTDAGASNGTPLRITRSNGMVKIESALQLAGYTVSTLPTCNATYKGVIAHATDVTTVTYNATPTGGGSNDVPVYCNGTAWTIH